MMKRFQVAFTHDYLLPNGDFALDDYDLSPLEECPDVELRFLPEVATLTPEMIEDVDALVASPMAIDIPRSSFHTNKRLTLIARTGVGYNEVDMQAATEHGVAVALATDGVRRPTAVGALAMILAATIHLVPKDRIARLGPEGWARSGEYQGLGLIGRTLGIIGFGSIGQEVVHLTRPLDLRFIAFDPYADPHAAQRLGVELVELDRLMAEADIVSVHCLLTDETRGFIDARRLGLMKPSAYLVNMARGPVVDQDALTEVLKARRIAGAALDVLCEEPPADDEEILTLDNVTLSPHASNVTDECMRLIGEANTGAVLAIMRGETPRHVVNAGVFEMDLMSEKLARYRAQQSSFTA